MDEVGKGAPAGPLTIGVVVAQDSAYLEGLRDSKKLSPAKRERFYATITEEWCTDWAVGHASNRECDDLGMDEAQRLAARRAFEGLISHSEIDEVMLDGPWEFFEGGTPIVGGDDKFPVISAASVVAKVTRDRMMVEFATEYPEYGFEKHKGYGTPQHLAAIDAHGACPIHRVSWSTFQ